MKFHIYSFQLGGYVAMDFTSYSKAKRYMDDYQADNISEKLVIVSQNDDLNKQKSEVVNGY